MFGIAGSGAGWLLTHNDYHEGRASERDLEVATKNFWFSMIPWVGIGGSARQLFYDLHLIH